MKRTLTTLAAAAVFATVVTPAHASSGEDPYDLTLGPAATIGVVVPTPQDTSLTPGDYHEITWEPIASDVCKPTYENDCPFILSGGLYGVARSDFVPSAEAYDLPDFTIRMDATTAFAAEAVLDDLPSTQALPVETPTPATLVWASDMTQVDNATGETYRLVAWDMQSGWAPETSLVPVETPTGEATETAKPDTAAAEQKPTANETELTVAAKAFATSAPVEDEDKNPLGFVALGVAAAAVVIGLRRGGRPSQEGSK